MALEDIKKDRLKKLEEYSEKHDPYPARVKRDHYIKDVIDKFSDLEASGDNVSIVGRVLAWRDMGKIVFADIKDGSGRMQVVLNNEETKDFELLQETVDVGDFLEVFGNVFTTKKGERSISATSSRIITKSLLPIPKEYYGLEDKETLLRKRYLDLLINEETKDIFVKKSIFWRTTRSFLEDQGFMEVETPVLEDIPGGAEAEPFITHHNALNKDFYLRISLELPLKKILVGGFESVFEIGRIFRNEGISREHLQDYTQMECYKAYWDYEDMMKMVKEMYQEIIKNVFGKLETERNGEILNWDGEWEKVDYFESFKKETGIDLGNTTIDELIKKAGDLNIQIDDNLGKGRLIDLIYKKAVRPNLIQPCFLIDPPIEIEPLAKKHETKEGRVERFQVLAAGTELGKGFSELNDPQDQRERFEEQMRLREEGDKEAQMMNEDFLEALEHGMPPAAGFGMSERLFSVLMDRSVRETVIFPLMKNENQ